MSVNPVGPHTEDPDDPSALWTDCVDGQGNYLGRMKLVQKGLSPEELKREMEYLANHPFYSQQIHKNNPVAP